MTTKDYKKAFTQLAAKKSKTKMKKFIKHNSPKDRSCGRNKFKCINCGRTHAHINKYGIHFCRHCFRDHAEKLGFHKYS